MFICLSGLDVDITQKLHDSEIFPHRMVSPFKCRDFIVQENTNSKLVPATHVCTATKKTTFFKHGRHAFAWSLTDCDHHGEIMKTLHSTGFHQLLLTLSNFITLQQLAAGMHFT